MITLILEAITRVLVDKKNKLVPQSEVRANWKKLFGFKAFNIKQIIKNNFDIRSIILKLFFCSFAIDALVLILVAVANFLYASVVFFGFIGAPIPAGFPDPNWPWIGIIIINVLYVFFIIRVLSDYYKLSLRGSYRNNYSKLLFLDIFTLNIFSIIGTLVFLKHKKEMVEVKISSKIDLNSQTIKGYSKLIFKVDMFMLLITLIMFSIAFIVGYFVPIEFIRWICVIIFAWSVLLFFGWTLFRMINVIIVRKMLRNLLENQDFYYLLSIIRWLGFAGLGYYIAVLVTCLEFDEELKNNILKNW